MNRRLASEFLPVLVGGLRLVSSMIRQDGSCYNCKDEKPPNTRFMIASNCFRLPSLLHLVLLTGLLAVGGRVFAAAGGFTEFPVLTTNSAPFDITPGSDGNLWFTQSTYPAIGRMTPDGVVTEFPVSGLTAGIAAGPDGALWFTEYMARKIGRITTAGVLTEYSVADTNAYLRDITAGPDGALWFIEDFANKIGRIATDGTITEFSIPTTNARPWSITAGPDGALWFTEFGSNQIGRVTVTGQFTEYPLPPFSGLQSIATGPDSALWFPRYPASKMGRMTTNGTFTEFPIPTGGDALGGMTLGPDNALWFTDYTAGMIWRFETNGETRGLTIPTTNSRPEGITAGPDNNIWFVESRANNLGQVGQVVLDEPVNATGTNFQAAAGTASSFVVATFQDDRSDRFAPATAQLPKAIVDFDTTFSTLSVTGIPNHHVVSDVNATLWLSHTWDSDLVITLIAPGGMRVPLVSRQGGEGDDFVNTTLDDQASLAIGQGAAPFTGSFQPESTLDVLNGRDPNGTWTLEINDTAPDDEGTLTNWSLTIATYPTRPDLYEALIDWGDGQTSTGIVRTNVIAGFEVEGTHTYAAGGTYPVTVTIIDHDTSRDIGEGRTTVTVTATVTGPSEGPRLEIRQVTGTQVELSWPDSAGSFTLEATQTLSPTNWSAVGGGSPTLVGNRFLFTNTLSGSSLFYRLRNP